MLYTERLYGKALYADKTGSGEEENYIDLMPYLPQYWQDIKEMKPLQRTLGYELWSLKDGGSKLLDQLFLETATWGLTQWEQVFGISPDLQKSYEFRRERIKAKLRGAEVATKQMIKNVAAAFANGEVNVMEYPKESKFVVKFVGIKGVPANMQDLIATISEIKPAHLAFEFEYTYNYWDALRGKVWNDLRPHTWTQIRVL